MSEAVRNIDHQHDINMTDAEEYSVVQDEDLETTCEMETDVINDWDSLAVESKKRARDDDDELEERRTEFLKQIFRYAITVPTITTQNQPEVSV